MIHWLGYDEVGTGIYASPRTVPNTCTGDFWESDPACYLTDEEIGIK